MQKFLVNTSGLSREKASQINGITLFLFMLLQPIAGALSDRIGRKRLMIGFGLMGVVCTYHIFVSLAVTRDPWVAGLLVMTGLVFGTSYTPLTEGVAGELLTDYHHAWGAALPY